MSNARQEFLDKLEEIEPRLRRAFEEAVRELQRGAKFEELRQAIAREDVEAAFRALNIDEAVWSPYLDEIRAAFNEGGTFETSSIPKSAEVLGVIARFDGNHPRAVEFAREHAAERITGQDGFIQEARRLVRQVIVDAAEENRPPRETALDIIGRRQPNGERAPGLLGLSTNQEQYVASMRRALQTPEGMRDYLTNRWKRRDRRFEPLIRRALRDERVLTLTELNKITGAYTQRLLKLRGETIARTESLGAMNAGRYEGVRQMLEKNGLPNDAVTMVWQSTPSKRTRDTHMAMNNQEVPFGTPFTTFKHHQLYYPGDTKLGAPPEEIINCRCTARSKIDFTRMRRG